VVIRRCACNAVIGYFEIVGCLASIVFPIWHEGFGSGWLSYPSSGSLFLIVWFNYIMNTTNNRVLLA